MIRAAGQSVGPYCDWPLGEGKGAAILRVHSNVIESLTEIALSTGPGLSEGGRAGVLLGAFEAGRPSIFRIESYVPAPVSSELSSTLAAIAKLKKSWGEEFGARLKAIGHYRYSPLPYEYISADEELLNDSAPPALAMLLHGSRTSGFKAELAYLLPDDDPGLCVRIIEFAPPAAENAGSAAELPAGVPTPRDAAFAPPTYQGWTRSFPMWAVAAGAVGLLALGIFAWVFRPPKPTPAPPTQTAIAKPEVGTLGLHVERVAGGFAIQWDKNAPAVKLATAGVLSIVENGRRNNLYLDEAQLASARIIYSTTSPDVYFSLQVLGRDQTTAAESVRWVQSGGTDFPAVYAPPPLSTAAERFQPAPGEVRTKPPAGTSPAGTSAAEPPKPIRAFSEPATRTAQAVEPALPSPPVSRADAAQTPAQGQLLDLPALTPPPPAHPVPAPAPASQPPTTAAAAQDAPMAPNPVAAIAGGTSSPPVAVQKPMPVWPKELTAFLQRPGEIVVLVQVDDSGKVTSAESIKTSVPGTLAAIAVNTSRLWRFIPAKVNGHNVPGTFEIRFTIASGGRR